MRRNPLVVLLLAFVLLFNLSAQASDDDNSLYDLGITTDGVTVEPEFSYDIWTYTVTVPGGTSQLALEPIPSSESAVIASVDGTELDADGSGTVYITVRAGNGDEHVYTLNVVSDGTVPETEPPTEAPQTEPPTEAQTEAPQTEPETEDSQYVTVAKNTIQDAENAITNLKEEITRYRDTISLYTKIMYALIALSVLLLFLVINLILRKRDLKAELKEYRSYGYSNSKSARKAQKKLEKQQAKEAAAAAAQAVPVSNVPVSRPEDARGQGQLDVTPQVSHKRPRTLPAYETEAPAAAQNVAAGVQSAAESARNSAAGAAQSVTAGVQSAAETARNSAAGAAQTVTRRSGTPAKEVEINMIDL